MKTIYDPKSPKMIFRPAIRASFTPFFRNQDSFAKNRDSFENKLPISGYFTSENSFPDMRQYGTVPGAKVTLFRVP